MRIESVIICQNYSDFLSYSLPENIQHFDRVVVVTHPTDHKTKQVCDRYSVDYIETEIMHMDADKFNKGRAINLGLSHLRNDGWLVHLDADIVLPHTFRKLIHHAELDQSKLYGCDRMNTQNFDNWEKHKHDRVPHHHWNYLLPFIKEFPVGARLLHKDYGYCPIGFFQMWHSSQRKKYPIAAGSAEHSDVLFAVQWPRRRRELLAEVTCIHLESSGKMGINWEGRKSPPFGPKDYCK